jgi:hypothetical protein
VDPVDSEVAEAAEVAEVKLLEATPLASIYLEEGRGLYQLILVIITIDHFYHQPVLPSIKTTENSWRPFKVLRQSRDLNMLFQIVLFL